MDNVPTFKSEFIINTFWENLFGCGVSKSILVDVKNGCVMLFSFFPCDQEPRYGGHNVRMAPSTLKRRLPVVALYQLLEVFLAPFME